MKISDGTQPSQTIYPQLLSPRRVMDGPKFQLHRRRRMEKSVVAGVGARRTMMRVAPVIRERGMATPLTRWKFDDGDLAVAGDDDPATGWRGEAAVSVSARKLAAGLWQLAAASTSCGGGGVMSQCGAFDRLGFELQYSLPFPKSATEGTTKWDPGYSKTCTDVYGHGKLIETEQVATISIVSALKAELVQAQTRIQELETERRSSKKKLKHFLRKLGEERTTLMRREHQKVRAAIDNLKDELNRESRNCQKMEIVNSKLLNDLASAKLSVKQFMQDHGKERKSRKLLENVCNELAKEVEEDKAQIEALKMESTRFNEEVEEERKMLQMAEVWREERVHMKLIDAKLILEEKYSQMNKLIADAEAFLRSRDGTLDMIEMNEVIRQAANSVDIKDMNKFSYMHPISKDINSIIEDVEKGEATPTEIDQCLNYIPTSHASEIPTVSFEVNGFNKNLVQKHSNGFIDNITYLENTSCRESVTLAEEQGSSYTPKGSNCSVRIREGKKIPRGRRENEQNAGEESLISEITSIASVPAKQSKKKVSAVRKLWGSYPSDGVGYKTISLEESIRLSNGSASNVGTISPGGSGEGGHCHRDLVGGQWRSPDSGNPHITRGMKGCIELPRGIKRYSLKSKLLESSLESQKNKLCSVLRQKS